MLIAVQHIRISLDFCFTFFKPAIRLAPRIESFTFPKDRVVFLCGEHEFRLYTLKCRLGEIFELLFPQNLRLDHFFHYGVNQGVNSNVLAQLKGCLHR